MKPRRFARLGVILFLACAGMLWGQSENGSILGHVLDPQGRAVAHAQCVLTDVRRGTTYEARSNRAGLFQFPAVMPATYDLRVTAPGFKAVVKTSLVLYAAGHLSAGTLRLSLGSVGQSVTVNAAVTPIQTTSSARSQVLDSKQIGRLMTVGRNVMQLMQTMPGVVLDGHGNSQLGSEGTGYVNGIRNDYNNVSVDGVTGSVRSGTSLDTPVDIDSVKEVRVIESGYQAEYGKNAGAQIQIVTKSGTSQFHGSLFYYLRNTALNANNALNNAHEVKTKLGQLTGSALPRPIYKYNTFGGTLGGPIYWPGWFNTHKNKLFFFFTAEDDPNTTPQPGSGVFDWAMPVYNVNPDGSVTFPANQYTYYKTPPTINDPATGKTDTLFPGNTVPASMINPQMLKLLEIFPKPNAIPGTLANCADCNYYTSGSNQTPVKLAQLRIDYDPTPNWQIFWMGKIDRTHDAGISTPAGLPQWLEQYTPIDYYTPSPGMSLGITQIVSPTVVNQLTLGTEYWKEQQIFTQPSTIALLQSSHYGINIASLNAGENPYGFIPSVGFGGQDASNNPGWNMPGRTPMQDSAWADTVNDDISWIAGAHSFKFGLAWENDEYIQLHNTSGDFNGDLNFSPNSNYATTNYTYADMLLGNFNTYSQPANRPNYDPVTRVLEWYAQDSWHATPRLTINAGVRFSKVFPQTIVQGANFNPALYNPADAPLIYQYSHCSYTKPNGKTNTGWNATNPAMPGSCFPSAYIGNLVPGTGSLINGEGVIGDPQYPNGAQGWPQGLVGSQNFAWAPRVGFAWDVFGDGKTALRGDYAIIYNTLLGAGSQEGNLTFNPPIDVINTVYYGKASNIANSVGIESPQNYNWFAVQQNPQVPAAYDTMLDLQHELGFSTALDIAYVGSFGRHFDAKTNINEVPYCNEWLPQYQNPSDTNSNGAGSAYTSAGNPNTFSACRGFSPQLTGKLDPSLASWHGINDNFFRPYPGYQNIYFKNYNLNSSYNALQVSLEHRFSHGLEFTAAYTWSKTMDYCDNYNCVLPKYVPLSQWSYGLAGYDRSNIFHFTWLWNVPSLDRYWNNWISRAAFSGWQYQGIGTLESGPPEFVSLDLPGYDTTGGGDGAHVQITGNPEFSAGDRTLSRWFDTNVFASPGIGSIGNEGRTAFRGPGIQNFDMALDKNFQISEGSRMQFRAEFYNAFNHVNPDSLNTTAEFNYNAGSNLWTPVNNGFGQVKGVRNPRIIQLALRLTF